ncbi:TetR/AcrR family transcriptional regulator [Nakamurella endophytica]|uniref:TetR family transcriptional regulator n=1 Tax=Nakamurella endophytica TaxID=1748367 RepID=A0A917SZ44_9ACTN|nr:WHG domain-containing protein [Nakamurella endophytica]GGM04450.1 TetR family transcriptional regulator [Nakamurella endophytica]
MAQGRGRTGRRDEALGRLLGAARAALEADGVVELSLRAVAKGLGWANSTVYRHVANRDALLALLSSDVNDEVRDVAEAADRACAVEGGDAAERWLAVARALRDWARAHPHLFGLLCTTAAPEDPARPGHFRVTGIWPTMGRIIHAGRAAGAIRPPAAGAYDIAGVFDMQRFASSGVPQEPFADLPVRSISLYTSLLGILASDVFNQMEHLDGARDRLFDLLVAVTAGAAGLDIVLPPAPAAAAPSVG